MVKKEFHEVSKIFPMMEGSEFDGLKNDIKENGLIEPIWLYQEKIIDGRNRYRACIENGVEPKFRNWEGKGSLISFVISLNLKRRHLNESQRAMVAAAIANLGEGRPKTTQICAVSQKEAAKLLNVSHRTVQAAVKVKDKATPELRKAVESGKIAVSQAAKIADKKPEEQKEIVEKNKKASADAQFRTSFSGDNEWFTPIQYIESARKVMGGIDIDPASSKFGQSRIKAKLFYTATNSGLNYEWQGRMWLNPPYSQPLQSRFIDKAITEYKRGNLTEAIILTNNYTDTAWFHGAEKVAVLLCFTKGRIRFEKENCELATPTQGSVFFYIGKNKDTFIKEFKQYGFIR